MTMTEVHRLYETTDAAVWAEEFMKVVDRGTEIDFGLMVGWFANAIETAKGMTTTPDPVTPPTPPDPGVDPNAPPPSPGPGGPPITPGDAEGAGDPGQRPDEEQSDTDPGEH